MRKHLLQVDLPRHATSTTTKGTAWHAAKGEAAHAAREATHAAREAAEATEAARAAVAAHLLLLQGIRAIPVIDRPLLLVRKHIVSLIHLLELLLGARFIREVLVRVVPGCLLLVGALDVSVTRTFINAQHLIVVALTAAAAQAQEGWPRRSRISRQHMAAAAMKVFGSHQRKGLYRRQQQRL